MNEQNQHDANLQTDHKTIVDFDVVDHGIKHASYFQGCDLAFAEFTGIATGCDNNPRKAVDNALEQLACGGWDVEGMEKRIVAAGWFGNRRKIPAKPSVPARADDCYYYLTIRVA
jgi:hypothetical protein